MSDQHGQTPALMPEPMEKAPAQPATPAPRRRSLARGPGCRSSTFASCAAFRLHPDETTVVKFRRNCAVSVKPTAHWTGSAIACKPGGRRKVREFLNAHICQSGKDGVEVLADRNAESATTLGDR